jgi:hypothetical protein
LRRTAARIERGLHQATSGGSEIPRYELEVWRSAESAIDVFDSDLLYAEILSLEDDCEPDDIRIHDYLPADDHGIKAVSMNRLLTFIEANWAYKVYFCVLDQKVCVHKVTRRDISNWRQIL